MVPFYIIIDYEFSCWRTLLLAECLPVLFPPYENNRIGESTTDCGMCLILLRLKVQCKSLPSPSTWGYTRMMAGQYVRFASATTPATCYLCVCDDDTWLPEAAGKLVSLSSPSRVVAYLHHLFFSSPFSAICCVRTSWKEREKERNSHPEWERRRVVEVEVGARP